MNCIHCDKGFIWRESFPAQDWRTGVEIHRTHCSNVLCTVGELN